MLVDLSLPPEKPRREDAGRREAELFRLGHYGTHLDRLLGSTIPLEYFESRALLFDISGFSRERPVHSRDVALDTVREGDFILFHTGALLRNTYARKEYMTEFIEFSWEVINALLQRKIRFIGLDARGLREGEEHREADTLCEESGVYVIENIVNTEQLPPGEPFTLYTTWFDTRGTGLPCRLVARV